MGEYEAREWISVAIGVVPAITNTILAFSEPGDGIIVMTPVYFPFYESIERNKRKIVRNPLILNDNRYVIDFEDLERKAQDAANKMLILCSPHNPVGRVWKEEELKRLSSLCKQYGVLIISD